MEGQISISGYPRPKLYSRAVCFNPTGQLSIARALFLFFPLCFPITMYPSHTLNRLHPPSLLGTIFRLLPWLPFFHFLWVFFLKKEEIFHKFLFPKLEKPCFQLLLSYFKLHIQRFVNMHSIPPPRQGKREERGFTLILTVQKKL